MNNLTTLMRSMTMLLFFVMVGASTAFGRTGDRLYYAERNGIGMPVCHVQSMNDPCDLADCDWLQANHGMMTPSSCACGRKRAMTDSALTGDDVTMAPDCNRSP